MSGPSDDFELICVNGHDRCYLGPDENCPYCEKRSTSIGGDGSQLGIAARAHYEEARKYVSGRPRWEDLDPDDPYDAGMIDTAYGFARLEAAKKEKKEIAPGSGSI